MASEPVDRLLILFNWNFVELMKEAALSSEKNNVIRPGKQS